jgi:hypothetical protein
MRIARDEDFEGAPPLIRLPPPSRAAAALHRSIARLLSLECIKSSLQKKPVYLCICERDLSISGCA